MDDIKLFDSLAPTREAMTKAIGRVVVGQEEVVDLMLTALFSDGHCWRSWFGQDLAGAHCRTNVGGFFWPNPVYA